MQRLSISMVIELLIESEVMCASKVAYFKNALGGTRSGNHERSDDKLVAQCLRSCGLKKCVQAKGLSGIE